MRPALRSTLRFAGAGLLTAGCLWLLAAELDREAWWATLAAIDPRPLAAAVLLALALPFWRAARLAALLPPARRPGNGVLTRVSAEVLLWNFLLPFKLGELSFPWLLHRRVGLPLHEATAVFLLVRVSDLAVVAGLLALGAAGFEAVAGRGLGGVATALGVAAILTPVPLIAGAGRWRDRIAARGGRLARFAEGASHARTPRARLAVVATTLAIWGTHVAIAGLALAATATPVGWPATVAASAAGNLAFALPISGVLGLGPQQVAFAAVLELAAAAWAEAVAAALCVHAVVAVTAVGCGLVSWWTAPRSAFPRGGRAPTV